MRIIELVAENFKRLRAVRINPGGGLVPIVGRNGAGKSSVLDAIAAALGGSAACPEKPIRDGEETAEITLDLGQIRIRRRWTAKGSTLDVFSPDGAKFPKSQATIDRLVGGLSFDPLAFLELPAKEQAAALASFAGVDWEAYQAKRAGLYDARTDVNRELRRLDASAPPYGPADPPDRVDVGRLLRDLDAAELHNAGIDQEVGKLRGMRAAVETELHNLQSIRERIAHLREELERLSSEEAGTVESIRIARTAADEFEKGLATVARIPTDPIRQKLKSAESVNALAAKAEARAEWELKRGAVAEESGALTAAIEQLDADVFDAISRASLPVPGLRASVDGVTLGTVPLSQCSGGERLRISAALAAAKNPALRTMLIRDGSLLDSDGMQVLAEFAAANDLQILIERVDDGRETGIRIVDGEVAE